MTPLVHFSIPPRRVLIIKPSAIGDVVHALPVLNLLRKHWPGADIRWLVTPACAGLLERHPQLNGIELFQRRKLGRWWRRPWAAMGEFFGLVERLRAHRFDLVIDLQGLLRSGLLAMLTRAEVRVGFANAREGAPLFYTHHVPIETMEQHALDRYLKVLTALGVPTSPVEFHFAIDDADRAAVAGMMARTPSPGTPGEGWGEGDLELEIAHNPNHPHPYPLPVYRERGPEEHRKRGRAPYAVLLPGTNWETKRWPVESFAALAGELRRRHGLRVVAAGSPEEFELAQRVEADVNLAGKTSLRQLVALLEGAAVVVANDSGPMHIAAGLGKPLVTMFGPTNPVRTGPFGRADSVVRVEIPCSPCYSRVCSHRSCLKWLGVESVARAVEGELERGSCSESPAR